MDIFSAGCVIAEIFLEQPPFELSEMLRYRAGAFDIAPMVAKICDRDGTPLKGVQDLVTRMLAIDPETKKARTPPPFSFLRMHYRPWAYSRRPSSRTFGRAAPAL